MIEKNNIDDFIKQNLEGQHTTPPPRVWENIGNSLDMQRKASRSIVLWRNIAAAAIIVALFTSLGLYFSINVPDTNQIANNIDNHVINRNEDAPLSQKAPESNDIKVTSSQHAVSDVNKHTVISLDEEVGLDNLAKEKVNTSEAVSSEKRDEIPQHVSVETATDNLLADSRLKDSELINKDATKGSNDLIMNDKASTSIEPENIAANVSNNESPILSNLQSDEVAFLGDDNLEVGDITEENSDLTKNIGSESLQFARQEEAKQYINPYDEIYKENIRREQAQESKKRSLLLSLSGQIAPSFSNKSSSGSTYANNESGTSSIDGGFSLNIKTNKRWSFETGIYFASTGQEFNNSSSNTSTLAVKDGVILASSSPTKSQLSNSMGNIKLSATQMDEESTYQTVELKTMSQDVDIEQQLKFVEVPLMVRYHLLNNKVDLSIASGVSTNFLTDNAVYLNNSSSSSRIGETEDINSINYSAVFGIGLRAPLWKSLSFSFEPKLNYFLNSVSSNSDFVYKPYSLGLFTGIVYQF